MSPDEIRSSIIRALSLGNFVSGEELANQLQLSRSSISNYIKSFDSLGLDVFSVKGRGYKLAAPLQLLDKEAISKSLSKEQIERLKVVNIVGSTNDLLKHELASLENGSMYIAECQTKGRGRRGRKWVSPFGASIYFSLLWRFESGYQSMAGLSLLIGIAVKRTLEDLHCRGVSLKWPNDVYINNKKLAGILIEVEGQVGGMTDAIIGIGINVSLPNKDLDIDQAFTDLSEHISGELDRNSICASLIRHLWSLLARFESTGLSPFIEEWHKADVFKDELVTLTTGKHETKGINKGIDSSGALLLQIGNEVKTFHGGEISVRKA